MFKWVKHSSSLENVIQGFLATEGKSVDGNFINLRTFQLQSFNEDRLIYLSYSCIFCQNFIHSTCNIYIQKYVKSWKDSFFFLHFNIGTYKWMQIDLIFRLFVPLKLGFICQVTELFCECDMTIHKTIIITTKRELGALPVSVGGST